MPQAPWMEKLLQLARELAASQGLILWHGEILGGRGRRIVRLYLDKKEGDVLLDECEAFSRALSPVLDVELPQLGSYVLEVSSPGLDRVLVKPEHFEWALNQVIELQLKEAQKGQRRFKGVLKKIQDSKILINCEGEGITIPINLIKKAKLDFFASEEKNKR